MSLIIPRFGFCNLRLVGGNGRRRRWSVGPGMGAFLRVASFAWSSLWLCVSLGVGYQEGSSYCKERLLPAAQCATALVQVVGQEVSLGGSSLDEELGYSWGQASTFRIWEVISARLGELVRTVLLPEFSSIHTTLLLLVLVLLGSRASLELFAPSSLLLASSSWNTNSPGE